MRILYSVFFTLLLPFIFARLLFRSIKAPAYRHRWTERLGIVPSIKSKGSIWVHAVSVGETLAAVPLINRLKQTWPDKTLVVTTMTPTGSEQVQRIFGDSVYHVYAPYDLTCFIGRFLKATRPEIAIIMETELWPNIIHSCTRLNIPVVVANARLSEKSYRGYARLGLISRQVLKQVNYYAVQTAEDGQRLAMLDVPSGQIVVTGNVKFDLQLDKDIVARRDQLVRQLHALGQRPVFVAASTHRGEDEIVLAMFSQLLKQQSDLLLILVPRHPERFVEVAQLCEQRGFMIVRRSSGDLPRPDQNVLLGDTMGELLLLLGLADLAFIGGSLVPVGGHNMIEAAVWGVPVITGPYLFNFSEASRLLVNAGAMTICKDVQQLTMTAQQLLGNGDLRTRQGDIAHQVVAQNSGALSKLLTLIEQQLA